MNKRFAGLIAAVAVTAALVVGGVATAEKPVTSVKGNIHTEFNGGFAPKTLSKTKPTPVAFFFTEKLKTFDREHLPPLRELVLEGDEDTKVSVKGVPTCESGFRSQRSITPAEMRRICRKALIGTGRMNAEIKFPDQEPISVSSELLAFNGGVKGGVTTFYLHAYVTVPVPAAIITTVKVKRVSKGRFGWQAVATIPKIAGGSGSITFFKLRLKKGILSARCPDGHLDARGTAVFNTTPPTKLNATFAKSCTGKN